MNSSIAAWKRCLKPPTVGYGAAFRLTPEEVVMALFVMGVDFGSTTGKAVIAVDDNGLVAQFAMNDRCAAGTGKFLETLARAVQVPLNDMGPMAMTAKETLTISSMC